MNWTQLSQASLPEILYWAESQPWVWAMSGCQQDTIWHAEGDVWTHTKMVCQELLELPEWRSLSHHDQIVLIFTALLHDVAKPLVTQIDPETGHTISPKHAVKGAIITRNILRELGCDLDTREEIVHMVRYHGRPNFVLERPNPNFEVIGLSWFLCNRLLYLFALADSRGRHTKESREETLRYWELLAEEHNCLDNPYAFPNDKARLLFFRYSEGFNLHYIPHEEYRCTVTMLSGVPGSGKDTWLNTYNYPVISLDVLRDEMGVDPTENQGKIAQAAKEQCRSYLRASKDFAFNATNILELTRRRWLNVFREYEAKVEIVYLEAPLSEILVRRKSKIPEGVLRELLYKAEPPTWREAHKIFLIGT